MFVKAISVKIFIKYYFKIALELKNSINSWGYLLYYIQKNECFGGVPIPVYN